MSEYSETDTCWHLMVRTEGGEVSMLQNLDAPTARQAYRRLQPDTRPVEYINIPDGGWSRGFRTVRKSDIQQVDIIGPEGAKLDPWRGVEPEIIDLEPERKRQEAYRVQAEEREKLAKAKAAGLGVIADLRPVLTDRPFRCGQCKTMQPPESLMYYLPDSVSRKDDIARIKEVIAAQRFNGHSSGWCSSCAPKEPRPARSAFVDAAVPEKGASKWWRW